MNRKGLYGCFCTFSRYKLCCPLLLRNTSYNCQVLSMLRMQLGSSDTEHNQPGRAPLLTTNDHKVTVALIPSHTRPTEINSFTVNSIFPFPQKLRLQLRAYDAVLSFGMLRHCRLWPIWQDLVQQPRMFSPMLLTELSPPFWIPPPCPPWLPF